MIESLVRLENYHYQDLIKIGSVAKLKESERYMTQMLDGDLNFLESLSSIRDKSQLSARISSKGALIKETYTIFEAISNGLPVKDLRQMVVEGQLLLHSSYETRRSIWNHINRRYFMFNNEWIVRNLAKASKEGINSPRFISLAYLYFVLRDRLMFRFVTGPLWELWKNKIVSVERGDFLSFLEKESQENPIINRWFDSTKNKMASNTLSSLRDFGLLTGNAKKRIHRPAVDSETVFHLLCILMAEGLRGQSIINATDWRMFLWSDADVAHALNELSLRRWIGFEKTGKTVIIELKRFSEVEE